MAKAPRPRRIEHLPETAAALPEVSPHEVKPESNPFTSQDWRMLSYAWMGLVMRVLLVAGGLFSAFQYMENKQEKRVERTMQLVDAWERDEYQDAQRAVSERLDGLNAKYASLLGANPSPNDRAVYMERIGVEAMTADGGEMKLADFRAAFGRVLYFLNRVAFCVDGNLCSRQMADGYFGDYALSFWQYFKGYVAQEREAGSANLAAPLEAYVGAFAGQAAGPGK
jgi:hypothetical protein